ncbi:MAG: ABC transporter permease [Kiritimatiellia bacterium]
MKITSDSIIKRLPALLVLALLGVFFLWPLAQTLRGGLFSDGRPTTVFLIEALRNPIYREGLLNSLALACATTLVVVLLGLPLAVLGAHYDFPGRRWLSLAILAPMILPPFVGAIGMAHMLGRYGSINALLVACGLREWHNVVDWLAHGRFWAVAITTALHLYPVFYLNAQAAISGMDHSLTEAAENLGCTGWRRFRRITLPLITPGLFAGGIIVFIWSFTELGTPLMFDYSRVTAVQIYDGLSDIGASPMPYALVVIMLAVAATLYAVGRMLFGRAAHAASVRPGAPLPQQRLTGGHALGATMLFLLVLFLGALPHLGVILNSFSQAWYRSVLPTVWTGKYYLDALSHDITLPAIRNSLKYASLAMLLDLIIGIVIAHTTTRTNWRWRGLLDALAMLPLAVPGIILAFGFLALSQPGRLLAPFNPGADPAVLLIIAYAVRRLPYMVRSVTAGFQQTPPALEEAAASLGCHPLRAIGRITLPLIRAHLLAGCLLAFSFAMLEVSDSLMLAQRQMHFPITKALFELSQLLGAGRHIAAAMGVWAMLFLLATLICAGQLLGRRIGNMFRI